MADLSLTSANVLAGANANPQYGTAGATITAGQAVYLNSSSQLIPADCNSSLATSQAVGIALNGASTGQPVRYQTGGTLGLGAGITGLAAGHVYVLSASATLGHIAPVADLVPGNFTTIIGVGGSDGKSIVMALNATGIQN